MAAPYYSLDQIVANFDRDHVAWPSGAATFGYFTSLPSARLDDPEYRGFSPFTSTQRAAVDAALQLFSDIANLRFTPAAAGDPGQITFANSSTLPEAEWGHAIWSYHGPQIQGRWQLDGAEVWVNTGPTPGSYAMGSYNFQALAHEIGHTIGLPHPGDYNAGDGTFTYANDAAYAQDSRQYTVMSYFSASNTGANHGGAYASTLLLHDIAAVQAIYGANLTTRTGDTTYGYNADAGLAAYDFVRNPRPVVCIWDAGGRDTLDLSGSTLACRLDLNEGAFSDALGLTGNIAIAYRAIIENARGGGGDDVLDGNPYGNRLSGGGGGDTLRGRDGADTLLGEAGDDVLEGGTGGDWLDGGAGADRLVGGAGDDTLVVDSAGDVAAEAAGEGVDMVWTTISYTLVAYVENLVLGGAAAINGAGNELNNGMSGNEAANTFLAGAGDDYIVGRGGGDWLDGAAGADWLEGGAGDDSYVVDSAGDRVVERAGEGVDTVWTSVAHTMAAEVENLTVFGSAGVRVTGNGLNNGIGGADAADTVLAGGGDDYVVGRGGGDWLDGGAGADWLEGGRGDDAYVVDSAGDRVVERAGEGTDTVWTSVGHALAAEVENLVLFGGAAVDAVGNNLNNGVSGGVGGDRIDAGGGEDYVLAGGGNDRVLGGAGADYLNGEAGDDVLDGGAGADHLVGGAGADLFVFAPGTGRDVVADLGGLDRIDLAAMRGAGVAWTVSPSGADTLVLFTNGDQIVLQGVSLTQGALEPYLL